MRKIVQISTLVHEDNVFVYALCDDGTLWCCIKGVVDEFMLPINAMTDDDWMLVANVPQMVKCPDFQESSEAIQTLRNKFFKKYNY
jgi:hypothetical protein